MRTATLTAPALAETDHGTITVPSSKGGGSYQVTFAGHARHCTCRGWAYRTRCRHVDTIDAALAVVTAPGVA